MNAQFLRSSSIVVLAMALTGFAHAADQRVSAAELKAIKAAAKMPSDNAKLERLALATSALRQMAESLDDVATRVDESMERLAANQALLQAAQINN